MTANNTPSLRRLALAVMLVSTLGQKAFADAPTPGFVAVTPAQSKSLGIVTAAPEPTAAASGTAYAAEVVVPNNQLHVVSAPLAGMVENVAVARDEPVKRGQRLASLASPSLSEVQRGYLQAATQHQLAKENAERDALLLEEGIISQSRARTTRAAELEAAAALAERRQALRMAGLSDAAIGRLARGQSVGARVDIVAPIDGIVLEQMVAAGERVEAAAALFRVASLNPLWLEIQVPAEHAASLIAGAPVSVPGTEARGKVLAVGRQVDSGQTVTVRASVADDAGRLRPGQMLEARIGGVAPSSVAKIWRVPAAAVMRTDGRAQVFVETATGYQATPVNVLGESNTGATVQGALSPDQRVVVRGTAVLKARAAGIGAEP